MSLRPLVLHPLGLMITPRRIGERLSQDVLTRFTRADDHTARHPAASLTTAVLTDIHKQLITDEVPDYCPSSVVRDPAVHWSPALARVAVWANGLASVRDARLWLWASKQPWFRPESVTDHHIDTIIAAAESVIAATPQFRFLADNDESTTDTNAVGTVDNQTANEPVEDMGTLSAAPTSTGDDPTAPTRTALDQQAAANGQDHDCRIAVTADSADNPSTSYEAAESDNLTVEELQQAGANLRNALLAAAPAAHRVLECVNTDRPPTHDDLAALASARTSFDVAVAALKSAGGAVHADTGEAMQTALADLAAASDDAPVRARLAQLRILVGPPDNAMLVATLAVAQKRADALAASPTWTVDERVSARTLATLHELAHPATALPQVMALQQEFVHTHPDLALLAVTAAQLTQMGAVHAATAVSDPSTDVVPVIAVAPGVSADDRNPGPAADIIAIDATDGTPRHQDINEMPRENTSAPQPKETRDDGARSTTVAPDSNVPSAASDHRLVSPPAPNRESIFRPGSTHSPRTTTASVPTATTPVSDDDGAARARLVDGIADLTSQQRFGLAAAVAQAAQWTASQQSALRIAALSDAVRSETGAVTSALRGELNDLDTTATADDSPSTLLIVASLLRAALVTGEPTTGAVLTELASRVEPNLSVVAEQVGRRALQGVLLGAPPLTVLADVAEVERSVRTVSDAARTLLRPRTLRFKRATDIAKRWMAADMLLGRPLTIAANDDRTAVHEVADAIRQLGDSSLVTLEIDTLDHKFKGASGKPIEGSARNDLVNLVQEVGTTLASWAEAVQTLQRSGTTQPWSTGEVAEMRAAVLDRRDAVLTALSGQSQHSDPLLAAASHAAMVSLTLTFAVLDGQTSLPAGEPSPAFALTAELLKVPGAVVDTALGRVTEPAETTAEQLLAAAQLSWTDAVSGQVAAENFDAADFLRAAAAAHLLPGASEHGIGVDTAAAVAAAQDAVAAELENTHEQLSAELRRARSNNEVSEEQAGELTGLLRDVDTSGSRNLAAVRVQLAYVTERLPRYRAEAARRLSERLPALPHVDEHTIERIARLIATGELSTAAELIYFLEIGEPVPQVTERKDLQRFFPAVPDALPRGLTTELISAVRGRGQVPGCAVLDFSRLSPDLAELAAVALDTWRQLATTPPEGRLKITERDLLLPALRLVGIESTRILGRLDKLPRGRDRRFLDVGDVTINGKALVPAFGSKLGGRLRVLLAWGQPSAQLLLSHADQDNSGESLLVAYFGTMSTQTRRELAQESVSGHRTAPVVVLDDAALAYLAAHGNRQMDTTMSVLLPFSNTNPYVSQKRGLVAEEMFYGRDAERKSVLDRDGTQLLYGGRGLGKSALLRAAGVRAESQGSPGERISLYLSLDTIGIRAGSAIGPDAIWNALLRDLTDRRVIPSTRAPRTNDPHSRVRAGVLAWLDTEPRRQLLVLLDESDRFFESDAPEFFETNRLKELGLTTDGRIKVVFAGLHSVQRYAKSARNGPFSHLAQRPTVIGLLRPQFATNLLTRPLQALGYHFADDDLINRVLGYCSYQPFLLQMFGARLVVTMHARRTACVADAEPPYLITHADVVAVESHVDLKADISAAFHDTLHLDPRYNVIANVLAHHAHEAGLDARLSDVELREECLGWWHAGFTSLDVEGFRAYLQEMVGLGVLASNNDGRGWHLRSPNVLHMIGTKDDVITQLVGAATDSAPAEFIAVETRPALLDGRCSPLTAGQSDDVLGDHANQVRVVLGSHATGISDIAQAVALAADVGDRFTVPKILGRRQFREELLGGRPGERRVVLTDLVTLAPRDEACTEALRDALDLRPQQPGVTRSAVIVAGPQQMCLWRAALADRGNTPALGTVSLRRYDRQTLRVWALTSERVSVLQRLDRLLEVTGGWPLLVERVGRDIASGMEEGEALNTLAGHLATPSGGAAFISEVGITADQELCKAFTAVLSVVDDSGVTLSDLVEAASMAVDDADTAVACLQALDVFNVDADGVFRPEPLLARLWTHRT